jgi:hypothetical protein
VVPIPAVTAGFLVLMLWHMHSSTSTGSTPTLTPTLTGALATTPTVVRAQVSPITGDIFYPVIWHVPLTSFAGGDVTVNVAADLFPSVLALTAHVIGASPGSPIQNYAASAGAATNVSVALANVPAQSLVLSSSIQRGRTVTALNVGTMQVVELGTTLGVAGGGDSLNFKNAAYAIGRDTQPALGTFTAEANYDIANAPSHIMAMAYPPAAGGTGNLVDLFTQGARDTLNVAYSEAEVWFKPDGKTVYLKTPSA